MLAHLLVNPLNASLAGYSYLKSFITGSPAIMGMPLSISTELTNNCNLHCPECVSGSGLMQRERGYMKFELFSKIVKELGPYLSNMNLYLQGEPMLHPDFFLFLRSSRNIHTVVSTNGHFLSVNNAEMITRSGLNKIIISVDGIDQTTYSAYRKNGSIHTVLDGIRNIADSKKKFNSSLKVEIQFLVNRLNEHQIPQMKELAKSVKASLNLKSMQVINKNNIGWWLPSKGKFGRYKMSGGEFFIKNTLPDRCARLWFNPVITWDGKVLPCCFDKNAEYEMGNLNNDSFREIWVGPKYRIFRKSVMTGRHMIEICRNCASGLRGVKY